MGVTPGRLPGATVSQDKTSGVRRSVEVELVGYLLLCHEQGMRKGQGLGEDRGAEKAATKWLRSTDNMPVVGGDTDNAEGGI